MSEETSEDELKALFLEVWATGASRAEIAKQFDTSKSWVQWMYEVTDAPPRRITRNIAKRISGQAPDNRLERRTYYKFANELKQGIINLTFRLNDFRSLVDECDLSFTPPGQHVEFPRKIRRLKSAMRTLDRRMGRLKEVAPDDVSLVGAERMLRDCRFLCERWPEAEIAAPETE
jgi:hypothetical protein